MCKHIIDLTGICVHVNVSSTDFVIFLVCSLQYTMSCFLNNKKIITLNLQLSQLFKKKIVIKTMNMIFQKISFKLSSQIQPPSTST